MLGRVLRARRGVGAVQPLRRAVWASRLGQRRSGLPDRAFCCVVDARQERREGGREGERERERERER